jgi:transglutaminase-like putative cysteine protease
MSERLRPLEPFPVMAWLVAGMALATLAVASRVPWWMIGGAVALGAWRMALARRGRPPPEPWVRATLSVVALGGLAAGGNLGLGVAAALPLFVGFLWIKVLELRGGRRDLVVTSGLGAFLVATTLLVDQSLPTCLLASGSGLALAAALVRHHVPSGGGRRLWPPLRLAGLMVLQGLPLALVMFLLVPRPAVPLPLPQMQGGTALAGVAGVMEPGGASRLANDRQVAFRVEFPGRDAPPAGEDLYWRSGVLWSTADGATWRKAVAGRPLPDIEVRAPATAEVVEQDITLVATSIPWAPVLDCPLLAPPGTWSGGGAMLEWSEPPAGTITYRGVSCPDARPGDWGAVANRYALALPTSVDPRVTALAQHLAAGAADEEAVIARLLAWYARQGFRYSLEPGAMGSDPLAGFLFTRRKGLCAHYAGASATLLRLCGIPARVVVGYHGGELNEQGGFLVVRQSCAHAWTEAWVSARRAWERIDATGVVPPDSPAAAAAAPGQAGAAAAQAQAGKRTAFERTLRSLRLWWEVQEARWDRWAMGWSSEQRDDLVGWFGLDLLGSLGLPVLLIGSGAVAAGVLVWSARGGLRWRRQTRSERALALWRRLGESLERSGVEPRASEGPADFAHRARVALPHEGAAIDQALAAYLRLRYAPAARRDDLHTLARAVARLAAAELPGTDFSGQRWATPR